MLHSKHKIEEVLKSLELRKILSLLVLMT